MKSTKILMTGTLLCLFLLFACAKPNIDLLNYVNTKVEFEDTPAKNNTQKLTPAARAVTASQFEQIYGEFYSKLGNRITFDDKNGLTPTKFRIGVAEIYLGHELYSPALMLIWTADPVNPDEFHADFTAPNSVTTTEEIPGEGYVEFVIHFYTMNRFTTIAGDEHLDYIITPEVIVDIPGYTVDDFPDIYDADFKYQETNPDNCPPLYDRKNLGSNTFHFTLGFLQPNFEIVDEQVELYRPYLIPENPQDEMDYDLASGRVQPIEWFIFNGNADEIEAALPGYPGEEEFADLLDYLEIDDMMTGSTRRSLLKIPFDGLDFVLEDNSDTTIIFNIDLEEIVEVYDYGTPGDKSDDVVIIANNWWHRMSLTIVSE